MEHGHIGIFLGYASVRSHALLDRALSLPKEWATDRARCASAGLPAEQPFFTQSSYLGVAETARVLKVGLRLEDDASC
jgi:hypothetical protein